MLTATETQAPPSRQTNYRPHLDGLRAVAVYLVVVFHSEHRRAVGRLHRRRRLLRPVGLPGDAAAAARSRPRRTRSACAASTRAATGGYCPAAFVTLIVTAAAYVVVASAAEVADAVGGFQGRRSSTTPTGTSSISQRTTSRPTSTGIRSSTSGRWRSKSSSTCCGPCCSDGIVTLTRRVRVSAAARGASCDRGRRPRTGVRSRGALHISGSDLNRVLRHRHPRLPAAGRRAARAHPEALRNDAAHDPPPRCRRVRRNRHDRPRARDVGVGRRCNPSGRS